MRSDFHFSINSSPLMMAMEHLYPDNLGATCSDRCVQPAQRSNTMVDEVGRVCAAHPRASPTSQTGSGRLPATAQRGDVRHDRGVPAGCRVYGMVVR